MSVQELPRSPLQEVWGARMEDWRENGRRLLRLHEEHERRYRERVCSKCPQTQRVSRGCASLIPGCDELSCGHMKRAFVRKHGRLINQHAELHPWAVGMRLNAELESRRR